MEGFILGVTSTLDRLEESRLPVIPYNYFIKGVLIGIPFSVLLHNTAQWWLHPETDEGKQFKFIHKLPILGRVINFFIHRWREDSATKRNDLMVIRNLVLFSFLVILQNDETANAAVEPSQYVENKILSSTAQHSLNTDIYKNRKAIFNTASEVIGEEEMNFAGVQQQRDAVLRRRYLKSNH